MRRQLDDGRFELAGHEGFSRLEAYEAATYHESGLGGTLVYELVHGVHIGDGPQAEHVVGSRAFYRRHEGRAALGEYQCVV